MAFVRPDPELGTRAYIWSDGEELVVTDCREENYVNGMPNTVRVDAKSFEVLVADILRRYGR